MFFIYNIFISLLAEDIFTSSKSAITHIRFVLFSITFIFLFNEYLKIRIAFFGFYMLQYLLLLLMR